MPWHSAYVHTGIHELSDKAIRDIVDLVERKDPDTIGMLERSMAPLIIEEFVLFISILDRSRK